MNASVVLEGAGLHTGTHTRVTLMQCAGEIVLRKGGIEARLGDLGVVATDRATTVACADGTLRLATVEHLFAALGGLGVREGIAIDVEGDELPLLDGAAAAWVRAIASLDVRPSPPRLAVARDGDLVVGRSVYAFRVSQGDVRVRFETDDARLSPDAAWSGDATEFRERIAGARTFAFARELGDLSARGLASHVARESVVVIAPEAIHSTGAPFAADEPARHKLLDLVGDLYLYGGPPAGGVHATRPGHAATHQALRRALADGIVIRTGAPG